MAFPKGKTFPYRSLMSSTDDDNFCDFLDETALVSQTGLFSLKRLSPKTALFPLYVDSIWEGG